MKLGDGFPSPRRGITRWRKRAICLSSSKETIFPKPTYGRPPSLSPDPLQKKTAGRFPFRPFPFSDAVDYEFRDRGYAEEFAALNNAKTDADDDEEDDLAEDT